MYYKIQNGKVLTKALEYSVADHCNLRCVACSHMSPFISDRFPTLESFEKDVNALSRVIHANVIRLLGGEPLLHPEIASFVRIAKTSGIADRIMVTTNGLLLNNMKDEFWDNVDIVWVSLYPGARPKDKMIEKIQARAKESKARLRLDPTSSFRTMIVTEPHPSDWVTKMIFRTCKYAHRYHCHLIHEGRLFKCSLPPFLPEYLSKVGINGYETAQDAFDIHGAKDLFGELKDFLFDQEPQKACNYCLGSVGKRQNHRQIKAEVVANPALEPVTRKMDLDKGKFLHQAALFYWRRSVEKVTGKNKW